MRRRAALIGGLAGAAAVALGRHDEAHGAEPAEIVVPLGVGIAAEREAPGRALTPVVDDAFVAAQLEAMNEVFSPFRIRFVEVAARRALPEASARLETRADRDALADQMAAGVANVFFVRSLRDVDTPALHRMGVCWRKLSNLAKRYVIVAASAQPTTLAHELGHFLGNGHTFVKNNLMSYQRDGGVVTLDDAQGRRSRLTAARLFATKELEKPR